jgi:hypothetical protein
MIEKWGWTECSKCGEEICSCCLHQRIGLIKDRKCSNGTQFGDEPCNGKIILWGLNHWCKCCPVDIEGIKVKYI